MSADQVSGLCEQLVKAVTVIMDPASTQRYRLEALKVPGRGGEAAGPATRVPRPLGSGGRETGTGRPRVAPEALGAVGRRGRWWWLRLRGSQGVGPPTPPRRAP